MTRLIVATLLLFAAMPVHAQRRDLQTVQTPERRLALLVGNEAYPKWPLRNPVNDAKVMAQVLTESGFQAEVLTNVTLRNLERAIDQFVGRIRPGDTALFFYAGHGIQIQSENYLVPVDFDAKDEADAKYVAYSASRLQERMDGAGARLSILVLDACRNNPFKNTRSAGGGLAAMNTGKGTLIAFATSPGKTADDNPKGTNGLFTSHLVKAIKEPGLSLDQVFNRVRERVYSDSTQQQLPWTVSSVIGEFYFQPPTGGLAKLMSNVVPQTQTTAPRVERQTQQTPVQATPPPVAQDIAPLIDVARNAYGRNDFQQAITKSQEALRIEGNNKDALLILASAYFRIMQFDAFVGPAVQAVKAGAEVPFLLGHHHLLTGLHASTVKISPAGIAFDPMGAQACNQRAVQAPWTTLLNAAVISNQNKEQFLHMRFQGEQNKVRNFNFADAESRVDTTKGVPIVLPTVRSQQMLNAIARVLQQLKQ